MNNTTKITMAIILAVGIPFISLVVETSQPKKIAYQASEEDQCVMFLQTSNETFYKLNSYENGTCEYTKGDLR